MFTKVGIHVLVMGGLNTFIQDIVECIDAEGDSFSGNGELYILFMVL
jgi:hypothetical protein